MTHKITTIQKSVIDTLNLAEIIMTTSNNAFTIYFLFRWKNAYVEISSRSIIIKTSI